MCLAFGGYELVSLNCMVGTSQLVQDGESLCGRTGQTAGHVGVEALTERNGWIIKHSCVCIAALNTTISDLISRTCLLCDTQMRIGVRDSRHFTPCRLPVAARQACA